MIANTGRLAISPPSAAPRARASNDALRAELAAAIVAQGYGPKPPLLASMLAAGFASRIIGALENGGLLEVVAWTHAVCERYAASPQAIAMLEAACAIARPILGAHSGRAFSADDLGTLEHTLGRAFERHLARNRRASDAVRDDIATALAEPIARLEALDAASAAHCRAVALWCERVARRLDLSDDECTFAARSGLLHDVGKALTPKAILHAPRGLTEAEWSVMREHATAGAALVREMPLLRPFASAARWHHERLDGKGYPDGLAGKAIPLHVRIVSVADAFNAMIDRRPYRPPMTPSVALERLVANRGTQFDPMVVEAMIDVVEGGR